MFSFIRQMSTLFIGWWSYMFGSRTAYQLAEISAEIFDISGAFADHDKKFVMLVGFSKSGKHTFLKNHPSINRYFSVNTDTIHRLLNQQFQALQDDQTSSGSGFWLRQYYTRIIRRGLTRNAFKKNIDVASDSCNLRKSQRKILLSQAKKFGYRTIIIWIQCDEQELLRRLDSADRKLRENGKQPAWRGLYFKIQKPLFDQPSLAEADQLITYTRRSAPAEVKI